MERIVNSGKLIGTWKLASFESRLATGEVRYPVGTSPKGCIMYDNKRNVAVVLSRSDRALMSGPDKTRAPLEEKGAAFDTFESYFGTYTVDEARGVVTHQLEGALFPNWTGTAQERFYRLEEDTLELSTAPMAYGGDTVTAVLIWKRQ